MAEPVYIGIDPDLQRPALAAVQGSDVVFVACFKTSKSKQQAAVEEIAKEAMHWMDGVCDSLGFAGYHYPDLSGIAVEAQEIYRGKTKNPQDIAVLAASAGVLLGAARARWPHADAVFALPKDWKKGVPKRIHQARVLKRLGVPCELVGEKGTGYCVPLWPEGKLPIGEADLNRSDWKHVVDAIGLAVYAQSLFRGEA
jgi:hypothetical protein